MLPIEVCLTKYYPELHQANGVLGNIDSDAFMWFHHSIVQEIIISVLPCLDAIRCAHTVVKAICSTINLLDISLLVSAGSSCCHRSGSHQ